MPKTTLYTLNVDGYAPEITALTFPLMESWAEKFGWDFFQITERKHPEFGFEREKFQIRDLMAERGDDYAVYLDADALVHPDVMDVTTLIPPGAVLGHGRDNVTNRFRIDDHHRRDGRGIGCGTFFLACHKWAKDIWEWPTDLTYDEIAARIYPIVREQAAGISRRHLADDFVTSRNVAKYRLDFYTYRDAVAKIGCGEGHFFHGHLWTRRQKLIELKKALKKWGVTPVPSSPAPKKTHRRG